MPKILILSNSSSGLYDFRNELIRALLNDDFDVSISVPDSAKVKELGDEGAHIIQTDIDRRGVNPVKDLTLYKAYKKIIKDASPDIVLTYTIKPNIYGGFACRMAGVPYVSTVTGLGSTFERGGLLLKLIVLMYRVSLKKCEAIFFQNESNRKVFEGHKIFGKKHVTVSGSGVNLGRHRFEEYPGHSDDVTRFLYIGRLMKEKGTDEYLAAAKDLHEKYGDRVSFAAIGYCDDDYEDKISAAEKAGNFKLIPYANDIHPYIKEADAIVHPSYHEGMSNVLMEAAATGRPVIASNISGCREIVSDKVSGILFEPRSTESLEKALCLFLELDTSARRSMGKEGRKLVEEKFDRQSIVEKYMKEICSISHVPFV